MKKINDCTLYRGDCLKVMSKVKDKSVDLVLCDLPYGTSACKWDKILDFNKLWEQYSRVIKENGAIVLFSSQPFTSLLITSNLNDFKYCWVWVKDNATNFLNKHFCPGKIAEDICVFGKSACSFVKDKNNMKYNPQLSIGTPYKCKNGNKKTNAVLRTFSGLNKDYVTDNKGTRLPNNVLYFKRDKSKLHPTQKPVALLEYLIKTYTDEKDLVLDNTMGSGSTGVACQNTNRRFIGIEKDKKYFKIAYTRIKENVSTF